MKLTVLIDNNTLIDRYFLAEPGVSYLIETGGRKILFDLGYSDAFITNARKLALDLLDLDFVVLSHGHIDHTGGLEPLLRLYLEGMIEDLPLKKPGLIAHPLTFFSRRIGSLPQIGSFLSEDKLSGFFDIRLSKEPVELTDRLIFLGEIERENDFEAQQPLGKIRENGVEKDDFLLDDSALAYRSASGLVIITGCSHAGICNIVEHARRVCQEERVVDIIGGFHLLDPPPLQLRETVSYLKSLDLAAIHACHCTDLNSKLALAGAAEITVVNRTEDHAAELAELIGGNLDTPCSAVVWDGEYSVPPETDVLIHATSIVQDDPRRTASLEPDSLSPQMTVVDATIDPPGTWLLDEARRRGCTTIDGVEVFVRQAAINFQRWTGVDPEQTVLREAVEEFLEL